MTCRLSRGGALLVGVLDAQDERPLRLPRPEPVEEGGADAADVEVAGRGGGEAEAGALRGRQRLRHGRDE